MRKTFVLVGILLTLSIALMAGLWIYSEHSLRAIRLKGSGAEEYDRHYMLVCSDRSKQWQSIYQSAREVAQESRVFLEWAGTGLSDNYDTADYMAMASAAKPDGIILYPGPEDEMTELIDEASMNGIPVVTVLCDDTASRRVSFIGVNNYQMGEIYGKRVLDVLDGASGNVLVLRSSDYDDVGGSLTYSMLISTIESSKEPDQNVNINHVEMNTANSFEAEEGIRDIFLNRNQIPDVLICLDLTSTECAIQALVDFNEVGQVTVIGYYASPEVMTAIERGIVDSTLKVDAGEIARLCINALDEYCTLGNVSNYFNIGIEMISGPKAASGGERE